MFQQHFANIINALRQGVAQSPAIATWFVRSCRVWLILSLTFLSAWSYAAAPVTSITSPAANTKFNAVATITIKANATNAAGATITKVQFYRGTTLLGTSTTAPYSYTWTNVAAGSYSLTVKATNSLNQVTTSAAVPIVVNNIPTVSLTSPAANTSVAGKATVTLSATASDTGGSIAKVEFFNGSTLIATDTTSPYSYSWTGVAPGTYTITAKATDNLGGTKTTAPVTLTVTNPLTTSVTAPANNAVFTSGAAITVSANAATTKSGTTISKVEFYQGSTLIGSDTTSPYSISWTGAALGTYSVTAKVTDSQGLTQTSSPITVKVQAAAPTISLTSPANNASFIAPANISLTANATANGSGNSISKVEYFQGTSLIATSTAAPFSASWANVAAGSYSITAKATDAQGLTTTSAAATIKVNAPPTISITSPANNANFAAPANITYTVNAAAIGAGNSITKVEYFNGATLLASSTTAPFSISSNNVQAGTYTITAKATDANGLTQTSSPVTVKVNGAPTISITSPANNASFAAPANITYTVNAAAIGAGNSISKVEYFNGATLLASSTTAPFSISSNNVQAGTYTITAKATDANGLTQTSSPITVKVNSLPTISLTSPAANANFIAPASITLTSTPATPDAGVSISKVEYFQDANLIATSTTAPFSATWNNVAAGSYNISAKVTDSNNNSASSAPVAISVINNSAPSVSVTVNPAAATAPATLIITATATDTDGSVAKVELFNGANLITTLTSAPYTYQWTSVAEGSYSISAKATDNLGASTASSSVAVSVAARQAQIYDIHTDHLGTPRMVTDASGNSVWEWISTPFGESLPNQNPQNQAGKEFVMNLRFPGQVFDQETGLHYNYFRDYDPKAGRYVESDPIGLKAGVNTYGYVNQRPTRNIDPMGLSAAAATSGFGQAAKPMPWMAIRAAIVQGCTKNPIACAGAAGFGAGTAFYHSNTDRVQSWADSIFGDPFLPLASSKYLSPTKSKARSKDQCNEDKEECKKDAYDQYERDMDECSAYYNSFGYETWVACRTRAANYYADALRKCDGK